jgi:ABC-type dipeptide/oligopeptide/nickel transport system permease subunit
MKVVVRRWSPVLSDLWSAQHIRWACFWAGGIGLLWIWDLFFLNRPALALIRAALGNSLLAGLLVVLFSMSLGWGSGLLLHFLENRRNQGPFVAVTFIFNLLRSVPQIVGILLGYVVLTQLIVRDILRPSLLQLAAMAFVVSLFVFLEVTDLIRERIAYYRKLDFFDAMLSCGIRESRIVNVEILGKSSLAHLIQKGVAVFGMAIFLQCSIDFILSVGLSTEVSPTNFPSTLGSMLARMDSKQDILAVSVIFTDFSYVPTLLTRNLQGLTIAFAIVYTLVCMFKIADGLVRRYQL